MPQAAPKHSRFKDLIVRPAQVEHPHAPEAPEKKPEPKAETVGKFYSPSIEAAEAFDAFKGRRSVHGGKTGPQLITEAINLLLKKYGQPTVPEL